MVVLFGLISAACAPDPSSPASRTQEPQLATSPTSSFSEPVLAPRHNEAATELRAEPECDPAGAPVIHLRWSPARDRGRAQKVAVTQYADGFETQRFTVSPRLAPNVSRFDWIGTTANGAYRWRVLTRHGAWVGSKISSFIGPNCGVEDYG